MYINQTYRYRKDGIIYIRSTVPEGAEVLETMDILNAEEGNDLIRISDDENMGSSLWLKNGDVKENYKEVKQEDEDV